MGHHGSKAAEQIGSHHERSRCWRVLMYPLRDLPTRMATIVVLRLVPERGDHQPRYKKNVGEMERMSATTRENRHRKSSIWPKLSCSVSLDAYNSGRADPSSFAIKASQTPYPRTIARRFSRALSQCSLHLLAILLVSGLVVSSLLN